MKAFKYRIYPTDDQRILIHKHMGCVRFIYNGALEYKSTVYSFLDKNVTHGDLSAMLPKEKEYNEFLKEVNSQY